MVSNRQSRVWGINRICSICYKSFLARNPLTKRCDECRKDDFFDNNTEFDNILPMSESISEDNSVIDSEVYKVAEAKLLARFRLTKAEQKILDKFSNVMRKEVWE